MGNYMNHLTTLIVAAGASILVASLFPLHRLIAELPNGQIRRQWRWLRALVFCVTAGYVTYATAQRPLRGDLSDLVVPVVFFLGACFIFTVASMSLQTAQDVRRMAILEHENITDPLMGIYNRRYLDSRLKQEIGRARRHGLPLSLLLLDIDHFKTVNDTRGHHVGDILLRDLARLILNTVRIPDVVARYGGEEILIIAPDTNAMCAGKLAERLRASIANAAFLPPEGRGSAEQPVRVTVSIGVAGLAVGTDTNEGFLKQADEALYKAKNAGRNRVAIFAADSAK